MIKNTKQIIIAPENTPGTFFVGGMGSGKSFFIEHMMRNQESSLNFSLEIIKKEYNQFNSVHTLKSYDFFDYIQIFSETHKEIQLKRELFAKNNVKTILEYEKNTGIILTRKVILLNQKFFPINDEAAKQFAFENKVNLYQLFQNTIDISIDYGILFIFIINSQNYRHHRQSEEISLDLIYLRGDQILFNNISLEKNHQGTSTSILTYPKISNSIKDNWKQLPAYLDEEYLTYFIHKNNTSPIIKKLHIQKT